VTTTLATDLRPSARTAVGTPALGGLLIGGTGLALASLGLSRRGMTGVALTVIGLGLTYQGLSGTPPVTRLVDPRTLRRPFPAAPGAAPVSRPADGRVHHGITIARSSDAVEALVDDPAAIERVFNGGLEARPEDRREGHASWDVGDGRLAGTTISLDWHERPGLEETEIEASLSLAGSGTVPAAIRNVVDALLGRSLGRMASLLEAGTIPTTDGQASARQSIASSSGRPAGAGRTTHRAWRRHLLPSRLAA
jgi:hypothetical protein